MYSTYTRCARLLHFLPNIHTKYICKHNTKHIYPLIIPKIYILDEKKKKKISRYIIYMKKDVLSFLYICYFSYNISFSHNDLLCTVKENFYKVHFHKFIYTPKMLFYNNIGKILFMYDDKGCIAHENTNHFDSFRLNTFVFF